MYIPNPQQVLAAGLAACGSLREMVDRKYPPCPNIYSDVEEVDGREALQLG